jgi:aconitate hydratase
MSMTHNLFDSLKEFDLGDGKKGAFYSLPSLEKAGVGPISKLPVSIRLVLESILRNCDGKRVSETHVRQLAQWKPKAARAEEIPFIVARIVLQDFTGVPLLVDLAAMRSAALKLGKNPGIIEPLVPVDLVVDHSVQVDFAGTAGALARNLDMEFQRNRERYQFLKWGMQAFDTFKVVPPGIGIVHQVNLEYLAKGVLCGGRPPVYYPDTLVGTDSHTTMINGLGIVGWGVGGIEAEAGMLGQPVYFLTPDVVGVYLTGTLNAGVTATDLALTVTQKLRAAKVVGKFVEFYGPGASALAVVDRATIANMAPEYGATMGFFPIDAECVEYLRQTGRSEEHCRLYENYFRAQGLFGMPDKGDIAYSTDLELDLATVTPSVAGPKRPQDRIELGKLKDEFVKAFSKPAAENGFGKAPAELGRAFAVAGGGELRHGDVLIAAITSCTNTSNPSVMLAAGLLAKKAVEAGLKPHPLVKASLAPGSRVVTDYLNKTGLQPYLDQLGFNLVGYGCTTCIGNSGPLAAPVEEAVTKNDAIAAAVLSGNRNFEARVHQSIKANFLMSPPLVVAFALAGRVTIDLTTEPLGRAGNRDVYLRDLWPAQQEVREAMRAALKPEVFRRLYRDFAAQNPKWNEIPASRRPGLPVGCRQHLHPATALLRELQFATRPHHRHQRRPPAGHFWRQRHDRSHLPRRQHQKNFAGRAILDRARGQFRDFNSYGSRRGNDRVMTRGTFANVRIKNLMTPGTGRRRHASPARRRANEHLRRGGEIRANQNAAHRPGGAGIWDGQFARLGGQGHTSAGCQDGGRAKFRAHSPLEPRRHGRAALAIQGRRLRPDPAPGRHGNLRCFGIGRPTQAAARPDLAHHPLQRTGRGCGRRLPHRHAGGDRLLPARGDIALCPAPISRVTEFQVPPGRVERRHALLMSQSN